MYCRGSFAPIFFGPETAIWSFQNLIVVSPLFFQVYFFVLFSVRCTNVFSCSSRTPLGIQYFSGFLFQWILQKHIWLCPIWSGMHQHWLGVFSQSIWICVCTLTPHAWYSEFESLEGTVNPWLSDVSQWHPQDDRPGEAARQAELPHHCHDHLSRGTFQVTGTNTDQPITWSLPHDPERHGVGKFNPIGKCCYDTWSLRSIKFRTVPVWQLSEVWSITGQNHRKEESTQNTTVTKSAASASSKIKATTYRLRNIL